MKHNIQPFIFAAAKKYAVLASMTLVTFNANAQRSGLIISITSKTQQIPVE